MTGHIKDHRKELQSDIWLMPPLYHRLWQYLKYKVNYDDAEIPMHDGTKFKIRRGQHLTSVRSIAQGMGWHEGLKWKEPNPKTISTILDWLVKNDMIRIDRGKGNREYTLVTLMKYEIYQERKDKGNSKGTADGEAREQLADIKKEELKEELNNNKEELKNIPFSEIIDYLNLKAGTKYKSSSKATQKHIQARWNDKYTTIDFETVIDKKTAEWLGTDMEKYLCPETLFGTKFEKYLNQKIVLEGGQARASKSESGRQSNASEHYANDAQGKAQANVQNAAVSGGTSGGPQFDLDRFVRR